MDFKTLVDAIIGVLPKGKEWNPDFPIIQITVRDVIEDVAREILSVQSADEDPKTIEWENLKGMLERSVSYVEDMVDKKGHMAYMICNAVSDNAEFCFDCAGVILGEVAETDCGEKVHMSELERHTRECDVCIGIRAEQDRILDHQDEEGY